MWDQKTLKQQQQTPFNTPQKLEYKNECRAPYKQNHDKFKTGNTFERR